MQVFWYHEDKKQKFCNYKLYINMLPIKALSQNFNTSNSFV